MNVPINYPSHVVCPECQHNLQVTNGGLIRSHKKGKSGRCPGSDTQIRFSYDIVKVEKLPEIPNVSQGLLFHQQMHPPWSAEKDELDYRLPLHVPMKIKFREIVLCYRNRTYSIYGDPLFKEDLEDAG